MTTHENLTAETITDRQIRELREEARESGDSVMGIICEMALGDVDPVVDGTDWEDRFGGSGYDRGERAAIMAIDTIDEARQVCADAIASALAMAESVAESEEEEEEEEAYGYTLSQWLEAAGRDLGSSRYDLRAAWRAGELPSLYTYADE